MFRYVLCIVGTTGEGIAVGKAQLATETAKRYGKELREGWLVMSFWVRTWTRTYLMKYI